MRFAAVLSIIISFIATEAEETVPLFSASDKNGVAAYPFGSCSGQFLRYMEVSPYNSHTAQNLTKIAPIRCDSRTRIRQTDRISGATKKSAVSACSS